MEGYDWIVQWSMFHFSIPFALDIQRGRLCFVVLSETVLRYLLSYTPKMTQEYVDVTISEMPDMGECWGVMVSTTSSRSFLVDAPTMTV